MGNWWDGLIAPFAPATISGYDFGAPLPAGGWNGNGQSFGWSTHLGSDFGTPAGETIVAPGAGKATFKSGQVGYGNELIEQLQNGFTLVFGHVASGRSGVVAQGEPIGVTGHDVGSAKGSVTLVQVLDPSGKAINPDQGYAALFGNYRAQPAAGAPMAFGASSGDPLGLGSLGGAIAGIPTSIGHGIADFLVVGEQDVAEWLKRQAIAFFVAAVVLLVLFA